MNNSSDISTLGSFSKVYLIGIGGIGMSALARYFNHMKFQVAGYDKTSTELTDQLISEGINIHFKDLGDAIPIPYDDPEGTLVIYTPAIPEEMGELKYLRARNFTVLKRSEVLGEITKSLKGLCVAGTHGKTTTSAMLAHILHNSSVKCSAFLGGVSTNYNSNFIQSESSEYAVVEADEYDRSFLQLEPYASIITSTEADHLDIYNEKNALIESFNSFANKTSADGFIIRHADTKIENPNSETYGIDCQANYVGKNLRYDSGKFLIDLTYGQNDWSNVHIGLPGKHNAENAIACIALCLRLGLNEQQIRDGLSTFKGVKRRFEYHINTTSRIYIDDYAHHPTEIRALISSVRQIHPELTLLGIFQPHLFSRTKDFMDEFAEELSKLDEVILMPIYPAREQPLEGITSDVLLEKIKGPKKSVLTPSEILSEIKPNDKYAVLTIGAGDIDNLIQPIKKALLQYEDMD